MALFRNICLNLFGGKIKGRCFMVSPLIFTIIFLNCRPCFASTAGLGDRSGGGEIVRVEVKNDELEEVWAYLQGRYGVKGFLMKESSSPLKSELFSQVCREQYFDSPGLELLKSGNSIRYCIVGNPGNANQETQKEYIKIRISKIGGYGLDLAGIADFAVVSGDGLEFEVRHYKISASSEEKHRLLGIVKRSVRPTFLQVLKKLGIENPFSFINVVNTLHHRAGFRLSYKGDLWGEIYLDKITAEKFGVESSYSLLTLQYAGGNHSSLAADKGPDFRQTIEDDLHNKISNSGRVEVPDYQLAFDELEHHLPFLKLMIKFPVLVKSGEVILFSLFGFLILSVFFYKRLRKR